MSVACPATRRDGRRRLRLRKRTWKSSNLSLQPSKVKSSNFKVESSNFESESLQTWVFKLRKWKSSKLESSNFEKWMPSKLGAESFLLLSFDKLQVLKLRIRTACSKLSYQSWKLKVVECWKLLNLESCWMLKVVEYWKLSKLKVESCWILKVVKVESWKLSDIESGWMLKVC